MRTKHLSMLLTGVLVTLSCIALGPTAYSGATSGLLSPQLDETSWQKTVRVQPARYTNSPALQEAISLLAQEPLGYRSIRAIQRHRTQISFAHMARFGQRFANFDALAWMSPAGQVRIYVNQKHATAPIAALASLLGHEALHHDRYNSLQEETEACTLEAQLWKALKPVEPEAEFQTVSNDIPPSSLVERLSVLEEALDDSSLTQLVRENPGYARLPEESPGFHRHHQHYHTAELPKMRRSSFR